MTNFEKIRSMTEEEMIKFLNDFSSEKVDMEFCKEFCCECEDIIQDNEYGIKQRYAKCELSAFCCEHFGGDCIKWWLNKESD